MLRQELGDRSPPSLVHLAGLLWLPGNPGLVEEPSYLAHELGVGVVGLYLPSSAGVLGDRYPVAQLRSVGILLDAPEYGVYGALDIRGQRLGPFKGLSDLPVERFLNSVLIIPNTKSIPC